jgi:hypothetical protein
MHQSNQYTKKVHTYRGLLKKLNIVTVTSLFVLAMLLGLVSPQLAQQLGSLGSAQAFSGTGSGTVGDPYLIDTCEELQSIDTMGSTNRKVFQLSTDIDCSASSGWNEGAGFNPINYFQGVFDGRGHTISGLTINRPSDDNVGLFATIYSGLVSSVSIDATSSITGESYTGSLAGNAEYTRIRDVKSGATVNGYNYVGGIIGRAYGSGSNDMIVEKTYFYGDVTAVAWAGGIAGDAYRGHTFTDNHFAGSVTADGAGGMIGLVEQSCGTRYINNALVEGTLSGTTHVGGFVARYLNISCDPAQINNSASYATLSGGATARGGIMGAQVNASNLITVSNVYFDQTAAGTSDCAGIIDNSPITCGDTTGNVPPAGEPFAQWDFENVWAQPDGLALRSPFPFLEGPDSVGDLTASKGMGETYVELAWNAPASTGTYELDDYRIEIKEQGDDWNSLVNSTTQSDPSAGFSNLRLGTSYVIRVQARTVYGGSDWVEVNYTTPAPEVFDIDTCSELQAIPEIGSNLDTYRLTADINCGGVENFPPIRWVEQDFSGIFDGQGHVISNITTTGNDDYGVALFSYSDGAIFRNVTLSDGSITVTNDGGNCGALLGDGEQTEIVNVSVRNYDISCNYSAGGLVGSIDSDYGDTVTLDNLSVVGGTVTGIENVGGLIGDVDVDDATALSIEQSYTSTDVSGEFSSGGIIGDAYVENDNGDGDPDAVLRLHNVYSQSSVNSQYDAGGIVGYAEMYTDGYEVVAKIEMENVYSSGDIMALSEAGGLIGDVYELGDEGDQVEIINSFVTSALSTEDPTETYAVIGDDLFLDGSGSLTLEGVYFDQTATGQSQAIFEDNYAGSFAINTDGSEADYFIGNDENPPLDQWDFDVIWEVKSEDYPILRAIPAEGSDLNGDGIPDSEQPNVGGYVSSYTGKTVAIDVGEGCELTTDDMTSEPELLVQDPAYDYANGLWDFEADCGTPGYTTTIKLYYYDVSPDGLVLRKHNPDSGVFFTIDDATMSIQTINNSSVTVVTYQITDNSERDMNMDDGMIADPAGLANAVVGAPNTGLKRL